MTFSEITILPVPCTIYSSPKNWKEIVPKLFYQKKKKNRAWLFFAYMFTGSDWFFTISGFLIQFFEMHTYSKHFFF